MGYGHVGAAKELESEIVRVWGFKGESEEETSATQDLSLLSYEEHVCQNLIENLNKFGALIVIFI